nr:type II toxin-antitoxin system CcdA family antitoxin [Paraburkholderia atlantica]
MGCAAARNVTLRLDVHERARGVGIDFSRTCEEVLRDLRDGSPVFSKSARACSIHQTSWRVPGCATSSRSLRL